MAGGGVEDFTDDKFGRIEADGWPFCAVQKVGYERLEQRGVEECDADVSGLAGADGECAVLVTAESLQLGDGEWFAAGAVVDGGGKGGVGRFQNAEKGGVAEVALCAVDGGGVGGRQFDDEGVEIRFHGYSHKIMAVVFIFSAILNAPFSSE